jgi:hypothetical protein
MDKDWEAYAKSVEANIAEIKEYLAPLEAGEMKLSELRRGAMWRDVTLETIVRERRVLATYEAILRDIRTNKIKGAS